MINKNDPRLTAYLLGELEEAQVAEIESAIEQSETLQQHVTELRWTIGVLHRAAQPADGDTPTMTADQLQAIDAAVAGDSASDTDKLANLQTTDSPSRFRWQNVAIAALVVYAVGLSLITFRRDPKPVADSETEIQERVVEESTGDVIEGKRFDREGDSDFDIIDKSSDLKDRVEQARAQVEGRLRAEVKANLRASERRIHTDPTGVAGALKSTLARVQEMPDVDPQIRADLETQLQSAIQSASASEARYVEELNRVEAIQDAHNSTSRLVEETVRPATWDPIPEIDSEELAESAERMMDRVKDLREQGGGRLNAEVRPEIRSVDSDHSQSLEMYGGGVPSENVKDATQVPSSTDPVPINRQWLEQMPPPKLPAESRAGEAAPFGDAADPFGDPSSAVQEADPPGVIAAAPARNSQRKLSLAETEPADASASSNRTPRRRKRLDDSMGGLGGMDMDEMMEMEMGMSMDGDDIGGDQMMMGGMMGGGGGHGVAKPSAPSGLASEAELAEFGFGEVTETESMHDKRLGRRETDSPDEGSGVLGDVDIQFVPELGQIVVNGSPKDVERVKKLIDEVEKFSGGEEEIATQPAADMKENASSEKATQTPPKKRNSKTRNEPIKTWKPASAATNRARLSVGHHDDLQLTARDTYVRIDGFRARVFFDCYYFNDRPQQLEGQFMLRLPSDASLHYFAFGPTNLSIPRDPIPAGKAGAQTTQQLTVAQRSVEALRAQTATNGSDLARRAADSRFKPEPNSTFGSVKPARVAPRQKAALAYDETVRRRVDPALVEWAGPGIFQTRVFPLMPGKLHRIIIGYDVSLIDDSGDRLYKLDLPEGEAGGRVEFDIAAAAGTQAVIDPPTEAFVSGGRAYYRFDNAPPRDYTVRLSGTESVLLTHDGGVNDQYFATRVIADLPAAAAKSSTTDAVFLLDTSWSDRPAAFARRLELLQKILERNRDSIKRFSVLLFNVEQRWWREEWTENNEATVAEFRQVADQLGARGGD